MARILMIAYTTYVNDARVKRHAQALAERGDHVDVLCLSNPQEGIHKGVNVIGLSIRQYRGSNRGGYVRSYLRFFAAACATATRLGYRDLYDVVIVCTMPDAAVLCALPLKLLGSKVVLDIHDTMPELYRDKFSGSRGVVGEHVLKFEEVASTWFAERVLAVHEPHRARLEQAGVRKDKISVVLNVPDERLFDSLNGTRPNDGEFTVVCHGTIAERLGLDVAIRAMGILRGRHPQVKLSVIGAGDHLRECELVASKLGLSEQVRFVAPVPLEQLPQALRQASLGLVPNRASSATHLMLPVKLLEYAAMGIPVIASRLHTIEYYFKDSAIRFFEPGDPADLAAAIEELYECKEKRDMLAANARRTVDRISWRRQRAYYFAAIDSLLGGRPRGGTTEVLRGTHVADQQR